MYLCFKKKKMDLVSIITINFNGYKDTCDLVSSLHEYETFPYELIIVDNGSELDEAMRLRAAFSQISSLKVIRSVQNLGFAGGNNLALPYVNGNYVLYLNNDIEIDAPFLERMVDCFKKDPSIGLVSPKIKYAYVKDEIQYAGFTPFSRIGLRNRVIGMHEYDCAQYDISCETAYAHGACMMTTIEILSKLGPMSEVFFLFYEELDWSQRIKNAGYKIWYVSSVTVYHKEGMSLQKGTPLRNYYMVRARLLYARRNRKGSERVFSCLYQIIVSVCKGMNMLLIGKWTFSKSYLKGSWDGLFDKKK